MSRRDPAEFENAFEVDDGTPSRSSTPQPVTDQDSQAGGTGRADSRTRASGNADKSKEKDIDHTYQADELPTEIRVKLRKLDKLESRYQGLYCPKSPKE